MIDAISRQAAIEAIKKDMHADTDWLMAHIFDGIEELLNSMPSVPVRKGKWIEREEDMDGMTLQIKRCSECGASKPMKIFSLENFEFNFCPNCGAMMSEGEEDDCT